jgi:hypothetical protein
MNVRPPLSLLHLSMFSGDLLLGLLSILLLQEISVIENVSNPFHPNRLHIWSFLT